MKTEFIPDGKPRSQEENRWWQVMNTGAFRLKLRTMARIDVEALSSEIHGACTVVQSQLEARGKDNLAWWRSARQALGYMAEKQSLVRAELARLNKISRESRDGTRGEIHRHNTEIREKRLLAIRALVEANDLKQAMLDLVDWMLHRTEDTKKEGE